MPPKRKCERISFGDDPSTQRSNLIEMGASLQCKKKKLQELLNHANAEYEAWTQSAIDWAEEHKETLFEIIINDQEHLDKLGPPGVFKIGIRKDFESLSKSSHIKINEKFYSMLCKDASVEDVKKIALGHATWVWNNREERPSKKIIERLDLEEVQKIKKIKAEKPIPVPDNFPKTYEDFTSLPIVQKWNETGF